MNILNRGILLGLLSASVLIGCGGGSSVNGPSLTGPALTGTAATGAAIAGGTVNAKCTVGTATGITNADGTFTLKLDSGQTAPCILQVTKAGTPPIELYGFASTVGNVNITPLTDLALTKALAGSPALAFTNFNATQAATITAGLPAAITYLQNQFVAIGLGTPTTNLLTVPFVVSDPYDKLLDNMGAALLGAGKTYADLVAQVKIGASLITIIPPPVTTQSDITVSPAYLALPVIGTLTYISDPAVLAGFAGSHTFGRGIRQPIKNFKPSTITAPLIVSGCTLSVSGGNLILAAGGEQVQVSLTPSIYPNTTIQRIYATILPRNVNGDASFLTVNGASGDSIFLIIVNGTVIEASANNVTNNTQTVCGTSSGGNQNTDRASDVLSLPTTFVSDMKAAALLLGPFTLYNKSLSVTDVAGISATVNFGRGTLTTFNANFTVNTVTPVTDCKAGISNGVLRLSSVAAGFDHTYALGSLTYLSGGDKLLLYVGGVTGGRIYIDVRTATPFATGADGKDASGSLLICPPMGT